MSVLCASNNIIIELSLVAEAQSQKVDFKSNLISQNRFERWDLHPLMYYNLAIFLVDVRSLNRQHTLRTAYLNCENKYLQVQQWVDSKYMIGLTNLSKIDLDVDLNFKKQIIILLIKISLITFLSPLFVIIKLSKIRK